MKKLIRFCVMMLGGGLLVSPVLAGNGQVVRAQVRDAAGQVRTVWVRTSDRRILYPRIVQRVPHGGGGVGYRPAQSSSFRPYRTFSYGGYYGYQPGYGYGHGRGHGYKSYGRPWQGRPYGGNSHYQGTYRSMTNYGVDAILSHGRGGGGYSRPAVKPNLPGLPLPRYSGNGKSR